MSSPPRLDAPRSAWKPRASEEERRERQPMTSFWATLHRLLCRWKNNETKGGGAINSPTGEHPHDYSQYR